jgi:hypothetical protein
LDFELSEHFRWLDARFAELQRSSASFTPTHWGEVQRLLDYDEFLVALQTYIGIVLQLDLRIPASAYVLCVDLARAMEADDEVDVAVLLPHVDEPGEA